MINIKLASVSAIIPCFNASHTILRTLNSIKTQTKPILEIICIDDCSSDDTIKVIERFKKDNPEITIKILKTTSNSGPSVARNLGWDEAIGDYIAFLDADNAWYPNKIELQYCWMLEHPDVLISGHAPPLHKAIDMSPQTQFKELKAEMINPNDIIKSNPFETSSVMCKREIYYRFYPVKRYCEDYLLWMQICLDGHQVWRLSVVLTYVFKTPNSLSSRKWLMRWGDIHNYWLLWQTKKIDIITMYKQIIISLVKFIIMLSSPKLHLFIKRNCDKDSLLF